MRITIKPVRSKDTNIEEKKKAVVAARKYPKCQSTKLLGYGMIIGWGFINLDDMSVDEPSNEFEIYSDPDELRVICRNCEHEWEEN